MQKDSESLDDKDINKEKYKNQQITGGNDFPSMVTDLCKKINIKVAFFLGILSFLVLSDVFIENVIPNKKMYKFGNDVTSMGTIIQIIFLIVGYIIIDLLVQGGVI
jgi:hypothetical protein